MTIRNPRIRHLIRRADKVAKSGKRSAAAKLYNQIIEEAPDTVEAYLGLASVVNDPGAQEEAYAKALELDPENEAAQIGLAYARGEELPEELQAKLDEVQTQSKPAQSTPVEPSPPKAVPQPAPKTNGRDWTKTETLHERFDDVRPPQEVAQDAAPGVADETVTVCYRHPDTQTSLRCNRCNRPICIKCAKRTSVGYRCPECIREIETESGYYSAQALDYLLAIVVGLPLSLLGGLIGPRLGFFVIFVGPIAGTLVARIVHRVVGRRRGRHLPLLVAVLVALGGMLPALFPALIALLFGGAQAALPALGLLIWPGIYTLLATGSAYYQMR